MSVICIVIYCNCHWRTNSHTYSIFVACSVHVIITFCLSFQSLRDSLSFEWLFIFFYQSLQDSAIICMIYNSLKIIWKMHAFLFFTFFISSFEGSYSSYKNLYISYIHQFFYFFLAALHSVSYHFSQIFRTSFQIADHFWNKISFHHNFFFFNGFTQTTAPTFNTQNLLNMMKVIFCQHAPLHVIG